MTQLVVTQDLNLVKIRCLRKANVLVSINPFKCISKIKTLIDKNSWKLKSSDKIYTTKG